VTDQQGAVRQIWAARSRKSSSTIQPICKGSPAKMVPQQAPILHQVIINRGSEPEEMRSTMRCRCGYWTAISARGS